MMLIELWSLVHLGIFFFFPFLSLFFFFFFFFLISRDILFSYLFLLSTHFCFTPIQRIKDWGCDSMECMSLYFCIHLFKVVFRIDTRKFRARGVCLSPLFSSFPFSLLLPYFLLLFFPGPVIVFFF